MPAYGDRRPSCCGCNRRDLPHVSEPSSSMNSTGMHTAPTLRSILAAQIALVGACIQPLVTLKLQIPPPDGDTDAPLLRRKLPPAQPRCSPPRLYHIALLITQCGNNRGGSAFATAFLAHRKSLLPTPSLQSSDLPVLSQQTLRLGQRFVGLNVVSCEVTGRDGESKPPLRKVELSKKRKADLVCLTKSQRKHCALRLVHSALVVHAVSTCMEFGCQTALVWLLSARTLILLPFSEKSQFVNNFLHAPCCSSRVDRMHCRKLQYSCCSFGSALRWCLASDKRRTAFRGVLLSVCRIVLTLADVTGTSPFACGQLGSV